MRKRSRPRLGTISHLEDDRHSTLNRRLEALSAQQTMKHIIHLGGNPQEEGLGPLATTEQYSAEYALSNSGDSRLVGQSF